MIADASARGDDRTNYVRKMGHCLPGERIWTRKSENDEIVYENNGIIPVCIKWIQHDKGQ